MNNTNELRRLGNTDLLVSPIGLGVMELAGGGGLIGRFFPVIPQEEKNAIIKAALDGGINFFDTAEAYGLACPSNPWRLD
jgi:aryl-alcohol dehydrogenase-like predicted oxidoreductase